MIGKKHILYAKHFEDFQGCSEIKRYNRSLRRADKSDQTYDQQDHENHTSETA